MRQNVVSLAAPIAFALRAQICRKKSVNFWIFLIKFPVERMGPLSARLYSKALSLLLFRHTATSEQETAGSHHKSLHRANRVYSVSEDIVPIYYGQNRIHRLAHGHFPLRQLLAVQIPLDLQIDQCTHYGVLHGDDSNKIRKYNCSVQYLKAVDRRH